MAKVIIFVTMSLWDEAHRGRHHYANLLCRNNTVIWINRNIRRGEKKVKTGIEHIKDGLYVLHTGRQLIPTSFDNRLIFNNWRRLRLFKKEIKFLGIRNPDVIWCYDYKGIPFINAYKDKSVCIYFCNDWFGEWT
ncbi:hypothetical protein HGB13_04075, partial [bacterium]|nr:hypothetical protein [bacterium]